MRKKLVLVLVSAMAAAGGLGVIDVAASPSADAIYYGCSTYTYYPGWGAFNRQGLRNESNPKVLYFYQDHKVGRGAAAGQSTTGGRGYSYCGDDFFYSVDKNL